MTEQIEVRTDEHGHEWRPAVSPGCDWLVCRLCLTRSTNPDADQPCERWAEKPWG